MPSPQVARLEQELMRADDHRRRLVDHNANTFTAYRRKDIVSELEFIDKRRNQMRSEDNQYCNIYNNSRDKHEKEKYKRMSENLREQMSNVQERKNNAMRRLHEYDNAHKRSNDDLAAAGRKITALREQLNAARSRR